MNSIAQQKIADNKRTKKNILNLENCGLTAFPMEVLEMPWIEYLTLGTLSSRNPEVNKIKEIPKEITRLTNLRHLNLRFNKIKTLPDEICALKELRSIQLWNNQIRELPKNIGQLSKLEVLEAYGNTLKNLPDSVAQLKFLRELDIRNNNIQEIPEFIANFEHLDRLQLDSNPLSDFPLCITRIPSLTYLSLSSLKLSEIPPEIKQLSQLTNLNLYGNNLQELCDEIGQLENLEILELFSNQLTTLPSTIKNLKRLRVLTLGLNINLQLPPEIGELDNLEEFAFHHMREGITLPPEFTKLQSLKRLNLRDSKLTTVPAPVFYLKNLNWLDLGRNKLQLLPPELSNLKKLKEINLSENPLSSRYNKAMKDGTKGLLKHLANLPQKPLPKVVAQLIEYQESQTTEILTPQEDLTQQRIEAAKNDKNSNLDLSNLGLQTIPESVFELTHLTELNLSNSTQQNQNSIQTISEKIGQLKLLKTLNLRNNVLTTLPDSIIQLTHLEQLDLSNNRLAAFPQVILQLDNLKEINLSDNDKIEPIWIEAAKKGLAPLQEYQAHIELESNIKNILDESDIQLSTPLQGLRFSWFRFRNSHKVLCEICKGGEYLNGFSPILNMTFQNEICYGCEGTKVADYEVEGIHEILRRFNKEKAKDKLVLSEIVTKWKAFEKTYQAKHENKSIVASKVKNSMETIRSKYIDQIKVLLKRFPFYKECLKKLHVVLYNQHLINIAIEEHKKLGLLQEEAIGKQGNIFELTDTKDIEKGMVHEMDALSALMNDYPDVYLDFRTEIQKVIQEFKAIHF